VKNAFRDKELSVVEVDPAAQGRLLAFEQAGENLVIGGAGGELIPLAGSGGQGDLEFHWTPLSRMCSRAQ